MRAGQPLYFLIVNLAGSSLPNCSGMPSNLDRSVRDFERSIASDIMSGVAVVRGFAVVVDVDPVVVVC
jgi:hypothetical protein